MTPERARQLLEANGYKVSQIQFGKDMDWGPIPRWRVFRPSDSVSGINDNGLISMAARYDDGQQELDLETPT